MRTLGRKVQTTLYFDKAVYDEIIARSMKADLPITGYLNKYLIKSFKIRRDGVDNGSEGGVTKASDRVKGNGK